MTDLNKDREVDTLLEVAHLLEQCKHRDLTVTERAFVKGARYAWQEKAKAQAVPETHLLIPKEPKHDTIIAIASVCLGPAGSEAEFLNLDEAKDVYQALVASESGAEG